MLECDKHKTRGNVPEGCSFCRTETTHEAEKLRTDLAKPATPLEQQVGGDHYKQLKIQPVEYIHANGIAFIEGNVIKYVSRWRSKGGVHDLRKARHFLDILIEMETKAAP